MDGGDILTALETQLKKRFPGEPVYCDRLPKGFQRPSFTLECQKDETADVNRGLVRRLVTVLVTGYAAVSEGYQESSRAELNRRMDAMLALWGGGALAVGDRAVTVGTAKGVGSPDAVEVTITFSWTDGRPGYQDPETATPETGGAPLMAHYEMRLSGKE